MTTLRIPTKLLPLLAAGLFLLTGCAAILPGNDPVVVRAEQATAAAFDVVDAFLLWEHSHTATAGADVHLAAEKLRRDFPGWLASARAMTKSYKANKTPENKVSLQTALAVLQTGAQEAQELLSTHH